MHPIKETRFKLAVGGIALGAVEALVKVLLPSLPLVELYGFQGMIIGYFFTVKTISNIKEAQNGKSDE
jgi:xanthosine utilization system XapX-like protein